MRQFALILCVFVCGCSDGNYYSGTTKVKTLEYSAENKKRSLLILEDGRRCWADIQLGEVGEEFVIEWHRLPLCKIHRTSQEEIDGKAAYDAAGDTTNLRNALIYKYENKETTIQENPYLSGRMKSEIAIELKLLETAH